MRSGWKGTLLLCFSRMPWTAPRSCQYGKSAGTFYELVKHCETGDRFFGIYLRG